MLTHLAWWWHHRRRRNRRPGYLEPTRFARFYIENYSTPSSAGVGDLAERALPPHAILRHRTGEPVRPPANQ